MHGLWWFSHWGTAYTNPHSAEESSAGSPSLGSLPQRPGSAPFLLVIAGMPNAESQQRIVKPFPRRQTIPCRAYWMTDLKAYGSTSNHVYELRRTQAVTYQYLAFSNVYPTPLPTFHAKTRFTEDQKTMGTRKQFIWKCGPSVVNLYTLLVISRLYDVMDRDVIPQDLTQNTCCKYSGCCQLKYYCCEVWHQLSLCWH